MAEDLVKTINKLKQERYLGAIIFGNPLCGKTTYIKNFISKHSDLKLFYLDAQELFVKHKKPEKLLTIPPKEFVEWIQQIVEEKTEKKVDAVFLDHIDSLYNIWSQQKQNEYISRRALRIEKAAFEIPIITIIQSDSAIEKIYNEQSSDLLKRIIKFNELIHL